MKEIIIHCSATPNGRADTARDIHRWHKEKGWDGIGYHYVICVNGKVESGRPEYWAGAHASGHNSNSIGVCMIGTDIFFGTQWKSLERLIAKLMAENPKAKVIGHNEVSEKDCPGFNVQEWLKERGLL